jgi:hypothetical protein
MYDLTNRPLAMLSLVAALAVGCGPFLLMPGGQLEGTSSPTPDDWSLLREIDTVQLETRPEDPYSVNVWAIGMGPRVYLHAGANRSTWVEHMEENTAVRLLAEGSLYDMRATRVEGQDEFDRFSDVYEAKYGSRPRNENIGEVYLFRLEKR